MKRNHLNFITFLSVIVVISSLLQFLAPAQNLSRQEFQSQLQHSLGEHDSASIQQLVKTHRSETIRFIEILLDSGAVKKARGDLTSGEEDWHSARTVAEYYQQIFQDNFYVAKTARFEQFKPPALPIKAQIIQLKNACREDFYAGQFQPALEKYQQALALAHDISDIDEQAALLGNIGSCRFYLGEFDSALEYYQQSLTILEQIGDQWRIGNRLGNIASVYNDKSDYPTALAYYEKAISIRKNLGDKRGLAADYNNMGLVQEEMGEYQQATTHYQYALALNQETENTRGIGKNLANLANVQINLGDYTRALQIYQQAIALRQELGDRKGEGNDLGNMGIIYLSLGDYAQARTYYQEALKIHRELGYREGEAYQLGRLAEMHFYQGEYATAIETYQQALAIHAEIGHVHGEAGWLEALGGVYLAVGDYQRSIETLELALEKHRSIGNRPGEANTLTKIGNHYLKAAENSRARDRFEKALNIYNDIGEKWGQCVNHSNLAYLYSLDDDAENAVSTWQKAWIMAGELGEIRLEAWIQLQLGDFYRMQEEQERSAKKYEQGLAILEELNDPELRWQLYFGQGQLWDSRGDEERAYYSYRAAINTIEEIRGKARISELKAGVVHNRFDAYESMIMLLLRMDRPEEAFQYLERSRSRNLLDMLGNGKIKAQDSRTHPQIEKEQQLRAQMTQLFRQITLEAEKEHPKQRGAALDSYRKTLRQIQNEYQRLLLDLKVRNPEYAAMVSVEPVNFSDIKNLLPEETVVLEYLVTENNTFIFVISSEGLKVLVSPEGRDKIRGRVTLFLGTAVRHVDREKLSEQYWVAPLQGLYDILIEPVEKDGYLKNKNQLIIVPQGLLHYFPFQALISESRSEEGIVVPHFLIEDYMITTLPSASMLRYCREKNTHRKESCLLMAPRVSHLPMSEKEVITIAQLYGTGAEYFLNETATESRVKQQGQSYNILHFATTAHFNGHNPLFSRLVLAESDVDDGNLEVHEIFGLDLQAYLVGLSACQTAVGSGYTETIPRGDDLISLTRAFIYAGTPSVVASLWEVADPSTALLMERFYEHLKIHNKGEALAMTQREMIAGKYGNRQSGEHDYTHPYHWAPFVLVGDWE
ncbi:MAG: CHAT domain-containing protein [bacterium]|nr:MAG: CHAT domain-containing protein [bacterium]